MKKSLLSASIIAALWVPAGPAQACPQCLQVQKYGASVVSETNTATSDVTSATAAIVSGFQLLNLTVERVFNDLALSVRAMSSNVTSELHRGSMVKRKLLDELNRQQEVRAQAEFSLEGKQFYEERYGEENIPMASCDDFVNSGNLQVAKEITEVDLRKAMKDFFSDYRKASPVDDWRYHARTLEYGEADQVDFNKDVLAADEVQMAMEYINQAIEPVPVSPIRPDLDVAELSADERELLSEIQTLNLRLDAPKRAMMDQVVLKAPIVGEDKSIQSLLADRAYEALDPDQLVDLSTGSKARILRTLVRDSQYGVAMDYEIFKNNLSRARIGAIALAQEADRFRKGYRFKETLLDGTRSVKQ